MGLFYTTRQVYKNFCSNWSYLNTIIVKVRPQNKWNYSLFSNYFIYSVVWRSTMLYQPAAIISKYQLQVHFYIFYFVQFCIPTPTINILTITYVISLIKYTQVHLCIFNQWLYTNNLYNILKAQTWNRNLCYL